MLTYFLINQKWKNKMKKMLLLLSYILFAKNLFAGEMSWNAYGHYDFDKIFNLSESEQIYFFNNKIVTTTSIGHNSSGSCKGHILYENNLDKGGFLFASQLIRMEKSFSQNFQQLEVKKKRMD